MSRCMSWLKSGLPLAAAGLLSVLAVSPVCGQTPPNAALQARAKMMHQRSGTIGQGYRPRTAIVYQQTARINAQALNQYGKTCPDVSTATAKEHLSEIQRNVAAAQAEVKKLGEEIRSDAALKPHVESMEKHYANAMEQCRMMEKTVTKDGVETVKMCECCQNIDKELQAAQKEHRAMLKKLGIEAPVREDQPAAEKKTEAAAK